MAPPRQQRTATVADDSRSEASSGTREAKTMTGKGRKGTSGTNSSSRADGKAAPNVTSAPAQQQQQQQQPPGDVPNIPWSDLPLEILHAYRHAYNLPIPSAYSKGYSHILLSQGIGLRSPTSIAVQRSHQSNNKDSASTSSASSSAMKKSSSQHNYHNRKHSIGYDGKKYKDNSSLHRIVSQDRVSKDQLALAVRKHFNSAGLAEQETIARFLYKVREEGKGRQFRLRFQP